MDAAAAASALREAVTRANDRDCPRIMFDARNAVFTSSVAHEYELAKELDQRTGIDLGIKCVVLYDPARYPAPRAQMMQTVVRRSRSARFRMLEDERAAAEWLRE